MPIISKTLSRYVKIYHIYLIYIVGRLFGIILNIILIITNLYYNTNRIIIFNHINVNLVTIIIIYYYIILLYHISGMT